MADLSLRPAARGAVALGLAVTGLLAGIVAVVPLVGDPVTEDGALGSAATGGLPSP